MFDSLLTELIGGGLSGGLAGGRRRRHRGGHGLGDAVGRTVMSPQGLTILGGLAIAAYEHFKGKNAGGPGGPGTVPGAAPVAGSPPPGATPPPFRPQDGSGLPGAPVSAPGTPAGEDRARLLISAMVTAAKADGTIDAEERSRILGQLAEKGYGETERSFLEEQMSRPADFEGLVAQAQDPVLAAEVYAASLIAINPDTPAEKAYLAMLAARLNLDPGLVREIELRLDAIGA